MTNQTIQNHTSLADETLYALCQRYLQDVGDDVVSAKERQYRDFIMVRFEYVGKDGCAKETFVAVDKETK